MGAGEPGGAYPARTLEALDSTVGYVALGAAAVAVIALLVAGVALLRLRRLRRAQLAVLGDRGERDLVAHAMSTGRRVDELGAGIEEISRALFDRMEVVEQRLDGTVSGSSVLRYDAFNESTGRQSSSIALLDSNRNGVVLSAILQREQARVYAKPVLDGDSELELSPEEREAIRMAAESAGR